MEESTQKKQNKNRDLLMLVKTILIRGQIESKGDVHYEDF
jgi:hypothetical protein